MRIIAGKFKGRKLVALRGDRVRPTSDRVKESLFSILRNRIQDANFLDLCAGSGNIGIEALSRGASGVTFVDHSGKSIAIIKRNLAKCNLRAKSPNRTLLDLGGLRDLRDLTLIRKSAKQAISLLAKNGDKFELVYFDPPYDSGIYVEILHELDDKKIIADEGLVLVEHSHDKELPDSIGRLFLEDIRQYGNTTLSFYLSLQIENI